MASDAFGTASELRSFDGLIAWRMEDMRPVKDEEALRGRLRKGDSYVFLHAYASGGGSGGRVFDVHFWQGTDTSVDEAGASALWAVQLDQLLDDKATQYRETEGNESKQFLQMFGDGVRYVEGGVDSGFRKVEEKSFHPTLLQVKGRRTIIIRNVPVSVSSLNSGDVFILDAGNCVYQWNGAKSSSIEKSKGLSIAISVRDQDRGGKPPLKILDEGESNEDYTEFMERLSSYTAGASCVNSAEAGGSDEDPALQREAPRLYPITLRDDHTLEIDDFLHAPLQKEMLRSSHVYALSAQGSIFVWIGRGVPKETKEFVLLHTSAIPERLGIKQYSGLILIKEGLEGAIFRANFSSWSSLTKPQTPVPSTIKSQGATVATIDISAMQKRKSLDRPQAWVTEEEREIKIWRVENFELAPVDKEMKGNFFSGDCYVVLCEPDPKCSTPIIYFWQGRDATQDERGASAMLAVKLDDGYGGSATLVRVLQGKEPPHFCRLFHGQLVIHMGGVPSGFRHVTVDDTEPSEEASSKSRCEGVQLYQVKGTHEQDVRAVEVVPTASNLNSGDCFILAAGNRLIEWIGRHSNLYERAAMGPLTETISGYIGRETTTERIKEGHEDATFWSLLGGKAQYADYNSSPPFESPRLFRISNSTTGKVGIIIEEIYSFTQEDLIDEDVMLLDVFAEVFLWVGQKSNHFERENAMTIARKYIETCSSTDGRSPDTPIAIVHSGRETHLFTRNFLGWDSEMLKKRVFIDPYEEKLRKLKLDQEKRASPSWRKESVLTPVHALNSPEEPVSTPSPATDPGCSPSTGAIETPQPFQPPGTQTIPYHILRTLRSAKDGIDVARKEDYLAHQEFAEVFGMSRPEFRALKPWRQLQMKKKVGLF